MSICRSDLDNPFNENIVLPQVGEVILVGGLRAIVDWHWECEASHPLIVEDNEDTAFAVVRVEGEDAPRVAEEQECAPLPPSESQTLVTPDWDNCHSYGECCESTGIVYYDATQYGGDWYCSMTWDGFNYTDWLEEDCGPFSKSKEALAYARDAAINAVSYRS